MNSKIDMKKVQAAIDRLSNREKARSKSCSHLPPHDEKLRKPLKQKADSCPGFLYIENYGK
jgi:hypothetical protein